MNPETNKFEPVTVEPAAQDTTKSKRWKTSRVRNRARKDGSMNPETNRFEPLVAALNSEVKAEILGTKLDLSGSEVRLIRPNGEPIPEHWSVFQVGETVVIKNYTFKVAYVGETAILFEPVGPVLVGQEGK